MTKTDAIALLGATKTVARKLLATGFSYPLTVQESDQLIAFLEVVEAGYVDDSEVREKAEISRIELAVLQALLLYHLERGESLN